MVIWQEFFGRTAPLLLQSGITESVEYPTGDNVVVSQYQDDEGFYYCTTS